MCQNTKIILNSGIYCCTLGGPLILYSMYFVDTYSNCIAMTEDTCRIPIDTKHICFSTTPMNTYWNPLLGAWAFIHHQLGETIGSRFRPSFSADQSPATIVPFRPHNQSAWRQWNTNGIHGINQDICSILQLFSSWYYHCTHMIF